MTRNPNCNKKSVLLILLFALTMAYVTVFISAHNNYQKYVSTTTTLYDSGGYHGYYDLLPFTEWLQPFTLFIGIGISLAGLWLVLGYHTIRQHPKIALGLVLLIAITPIANSPTTNCNHQPHLDWDQPPTPPARNDTTNFVRIVDVLCCADEEFMQDPSRKSDVETNIQRANIYVGSVSDECFEDLGLSFQVRGWIEFDSLDDRPFTYSTFYMLEEAVEETGFYDGMLFANRTIDLLFVITGQVIDMIGLSIPWWYAAIMEANYISDDNDFARIRHEFSHQFWAQHCDNYCVMNLDDFFTPKTFAWCNYHEQWLLEHKYIKAHDCNISVHPAQQGSVFGRTQPNGDYIRRVGENITLQAYPDVGYQFCYWSICGENFCLLKTPTANPYTFHLTEELHNLSHNIWNITAYFKENLNCSYWIPLYTIN